MAMFDSVLYALLRTYVKKSLIGAGAIKGASCQILSIERNLTDDGTVVTFKYEDNAGGVHTSTMNVPDGEIGPQGPKGDKGDKGDAGGSTVEYTQSLQSGTKIGEIIINGTKTNIFAPSGGSGSSTLSELTDVDLSTLSDGDVLVYDNTNGKWVNKSPEEGALITAVLSKDTMPTASSEYEDIVILYIGTTSATYTKGHLYLCVENSGSYSWTDVTPSGGTPQVAQFEVTTNGWTADTTSQSGTTLYKKAIALTQVDTEFPIVNIGSTGSLPTKVQQTAYDLLQYVTVDSTVPCLYLYASAIPTDAFYIKVEGVA